MFLFSWFFGHFRAIVASVLHLILAHTIGANSFIDPYLKTLAGQIGSEMNGSKGSGDSNAISTPNFIVYGDRENQKGGQSDYVTADKVAVPKSRSTASFFRNPFGLFNDRLNSWHWIPTSMAALEEAERKLLQTVKSSMKCKYVPVWHGKFQIWTAVLSSRFNATPKISAGESDETPLVLLHGLGGGIGLWVKNFDALCQKRTVYALDLLGFGKSSRPSFSNDPAIIEQEWVQSIEDFRQDAKIDKMILLGHSLGGYLACAYAMEYPDRIRHLILADPWGFGIRTLESERTVQIPSWVRTVAALASVFNPLAALRAMGPYGHSFLRRIRPDIGRKFPDQADSGAIFDYIYHCNVQPPSGEIAFKGLTLAYGWARRPMIERIRSIPAEVPMTFIYGSRSWIDCTPAYEIQRQDRTGSYVRVAVISGAGHHVYADHADVFNELVNEVCDIVDAGDDVAPILDEPEDFNVRVDIAAPTIESPDN